MLEKLGVNENFGNIR